MTRHVRCPECGQKLHVPENAGRRLVCAACGSLVSAPAADGEPAGPSDLPPVGDYFRELLTSAEGLGTASLLCACLALPLLCLPYVGLISLAVCAAGVYLGARGLVRYLTVESPGLPAGAVLQRAVWVGDRRLVLPLAGTVASLILFLVVLWPWLP
jgi:DNA-directed RNA polymerase subunit RPC12/RpoP